MASVETSESENRADAHDQRRDDAESNPDQRESRTRVVGIGIVGIMPRRAASGNPYTVGRIEVAAVGACRAATRDQWWTFGALDIAGWAAAIACVDEQWQALVATVTTIVGGHAAFVRLWWRASLVVAFPVTTAIIAR